MDPLAAAQAEAEAGPTRREALAAQAQHQVVALVQTCQALLAAYGAAAAGTGGGSDEAAATASASRASAEIERLHDQYVERRAALRESLERCRRFDDDAKEEQEDGRAAGGGDDLAALRARRAALQAELEGKNATIKATIDRLREMLDALQLLKAEVAG
jgi:hypothetical protein